MKSEKNHLDLSREPQRLALLGDTHGNTVWTRKALAHLAKQGVDTVVQVGDFGYRFESGFVGEVNRTAERLEMVVHFVDGNHDDHDYLSRLPRTAQGVGVVADRIGHLPRGTRWTWNGLRFLALGGAASVDRSLRGPGEWWPQELTSDDDVARAIDGGACDILVAHDAPAGVELPPSALGPPGAWPGEDILLAGRNRARLREVVEAVKADRVICGHYHVRHDADLLREDGAITQVSVLTRDRQPFEDASLVL